MNVKQVLVVRRDLGMRRGKEITQGGHAASLWLLDRIRWMIDSLGYLMESSFTEAEIEWMKGNYRKITLQVQSEQELQDLRRRAHEKGIKAFLVTDLGATEFHGVPTVTALAIGPDYDELIDPITKDLKLY